MKVTVRLASLLLFMLTLMACSSETAVPQPTTQPTIQPTTQPTIQPTTQPTIQPTTSLFTYDTDSYPWWNDTVFYQIFVRSFYDSDGDGVGDLNGIIEKLDYLNDGDPSTSDDLGVTGIWLMPIMESPSYHGYDVVDYYQVDEEYGTNEEFKRLVEEAHARGIRVVVDLVMNHTSVEHPWFQEARDPGSDKRDWYIWVDENPGYRGPWGQEVWHRAGDSYYYGVFWSGMPDLNYETPEVSETMLEIVRFWLEEMGADGFRLDGLKHLFENGQLMENVAQTHDWLKAFYTFYKDVNPGAFTVGEVWSPTQQVVKYVGDEVDVAFEFDLAQAILNSARSGFAKQVADAQERVVESFPPGQYATFIANHDQDRTMSQLSGNEGKARLAATLQLTFSGVPFIYYGEEIGMTGTKPDEDIRRPMQWNGDSFKVGFTEGIPWRSPAADYSERNVAAQDGDPGSLLNHYRALIHLRNNHEALRIGDWTKVATGASSVHAFLRHSDDEVILVLLNLTSEPVSDYSLDLEEGPLAGPVAATLLLGEGEPAALAVNAAGGFSDYKPLDTLPGQSSILIQLAPVGD